MKRALQVLVLLVAALSGYLAFRPVQIEPVAREAPPSPGYDGPHAANQRLGAAQVVSVPPEIGPEHIGFGPDGKLYTGVLSGAVLRMNVDGDSLSAGFDDGPMPAP